ncbi:hypothetical protein K470DRAFT_64789 [Piedraia hortae CBS 480.64]|uniref:Uncharacterized protein n=1 Tax=Piedraia hortae CBS 480.64 TaxID=1314780 RepID=A0A6A7C134_9PEZI|nr:hypothetical protein K470DRAFT_64789 [Piedraia hortae CBS 480.64]
MAALCIKGPHKAYFTHSTTVLNNGSTLHSTLNITNGTPYPWPGTSTVQATNLTPRTVASLISGCHDNQEFKAFPIRPIDSQTVELDLHFPRNTIPTRAEFLIANG